MFFFTEITILLKDALNKICIKTESQFMSYPTVNELFVEFSEVGKIMDSF